MNIDWSIAPEGAIGHVFPTNEGEHEIWYRRDASGGLEYCIASNTDVWLESCLVPDQVVWRKEQVVSGWTGEGLPPVGTVCEFMKHNSPPAPEGQWTNGDIRYLSDYTVIIGGDRCEHVHHPRNCSFRPVRTPEQIAAEEREKAIDVLMQMTSSLGHSDVSKKILFSELYDKGLRFEMKP